MPVVAAAIAVVALLGVGSLMPSRVTPTLAAFTDAATVPTGSLATTTVPKPTITLHGHWCVALAEDRHDGWTVVGATDYTLTHRSDGADADGD